MIELPSTNPHARADLSILMTAFNAERYLNEAISSIVAQKTQRSWELIFVDDGSIDSTLKVAQQSAEQLGSRMRILHHPGNANRGISASRNLALRHARASLTAFLDADDVWLPHHLETQAELLDEHPNIDMVYANAERWVHFDEAFDEDSARAAYWGENYLPPLVPPGAALGRLQKGILLDWFRSDESFVPCICTVMLRTEAARAVEGFCDDFRGLYDDQVFHAKMSGAYSIYAHDVCVARYRQHSVSCCAQARLHETIQGEEESRFKHFLSSNALSGESQV